MEAIVGEELEERVGAIIFTPQPSAHSIAHEQLLLPEYPSALAIMKRLRQAPRDLVDLSDRCDSRLVVRANVEDRTHFIP